MAILFYEGLPGAGKSYEAMVTRIIPALQKGREVVAYIEGLDFGRIAEAAELPEERVRELLFPLVREDMQPVEEPDGRRKKVKDGVWLAAVRDNALHVFDEAQNWWPHTMKPTGELTQFVTEHRHRGIDVLLMGQAIPDVHALWRRRVDQRLVFLKLTGLGTSKRYSCTVYKGKGNDQYDKVTTKVAKYDEKYFGTYKSVVADDTNVDNLVDKRSTIWGGSMFTFWIPLALVAGCFGAWKAYSFFKPPVVEKAPVVQAQPKQQQQQSSQQQPQSNAQPVRSEAAPKDERSPQEKYFADLADKARIRLAGLVVFNGNTQGLVEWVDGGNHVTERIDLMQLRDMGVSVLQVGQSVRLTLGAWQQIATMWPMDVPGRVPDGTQNALRPKEPQDVNGPVTVVAQANSQPRRDSQGGEFVQQDSYSQGLARRNAQVRSVFEQR